MKIPWTERILWIIGFCFLFFIIKVVFPEPHHPTDKDYAQAIVGEASNQSVGTMICVAHALRNRGNLRGVNGYNAPHIKNESKLTWRKAEIAWELSGKEKEDPVHGASNFGTFDDLEDVGVNTEDTIAQCGDFYFY
jgi:hypothetical protein